MTRAEWERARALADAGVGPPPPPLRRAVPQHARKLERPAAGRAPRAGVAPPEPPVDPLARADAKRDEKRLREEHADLVERLREEKRRNAFLDAVSLPTPPVRIERAERASGLREMTAVAIASDWHVEEPVEPEKVEGRNEYTLAIADRRVTRFFDAIIDMVDHHRAGGRIVVRDLVLGFIGDLMTGDIHDELVESSQLSPTLTALWLKPRIVAGVRRVADALDLRSVTIPWCRGNHGRIGQKKKVSTGAENSYEWLLGKLVEQDLADDPRVRCVTTKSEHQFVRVYDWTLGFTHGDQINYGGGVGGISIPILKALSSLDSVKRADLRFMGHFHQFRDLHAVIVNGSLIGYAPFGYHVKAPYEPPAQAFCLIDSARFKCQVTPLWVDELAAAA